MSGTDRQHTNNAPQQLLCQQTANTSLFDSKVTKTKSFELGSWHEMTFLFIHVNLNANDLSVYIFNFLNSCSQNVKCKS